VEAGWVLLALLPCPALIIHGQVVQRQQDGRVLQAMEEASRQALHDVMVQQQQQQQQQQNLGSTWGCSQDRCWLEGCWQHNRLLQTTQQSQRNHGCLLCML
jgi:hypothetical protein